MIVKIAACLYILQAALCLLVLALLPFGFSASMENLATLLLCGLFAAMGVGLLKRSPWARWLALGNSLLGWTLGSLALLGLLAGAVFLGSLAALFNTGLGFLFGLLVLFIVLVFIATIVVSFLLYFHLRSEAGAQEFGVELESFGSVMGSVGTWFVIAVVQSMMSSGGVGSYFPSRGLSEAYEQDAAQTRERWSKVQRERPRVEAPERQESEDGQLEPGVPEAESDVQTEPAETSTPDESQMAEEAKLPDFSATTVNANETESGETTRNQILKCRDASGAVQYTQGYCPPGTTRVEMPVHD